MAGIVMHLAFVCLISDGIRLREALLEMGTAVGEEPRIGGGMHQHPELRELAVLMMRVPRLDLTCGSGRTNKSGWTVIGILVQKMVELREMKIIIHWLSTTI